MTFNATLDSMCSPCSYKRHVLEFQDREACLVLLVDDSEQYVHISKMLSVLEISNSWFFASLTSIAAETTDW